MQLQNTEPWVSLEEVAEYLGVNKDTVRNWTYLHIKSGENGSLNYPKSMNG